MILLRAIPFSFAILWRYVIALPVLIMMLVAFGVIAGILALLMWLVSPLLALIIIMAFSFGATVIPVMVGLRVGLQAHHVKPRINYLQMMKPAIGYGMFEAVVILVVFVVAVAVIVLLSPISPEELWALGRAEAEIEPAQLIAANPILGWALIGVLALTAFAIRAALLVPFAGASIGADPSGRPHTPFFGFGSSFLSVFILVLLSQLGLSFAVPIALFILEFFGIAQAAVLQIVLVAGFFQGPSDLADLRSEALILIGTVVFLFLFFFSLQCAGAALIFVDQYKQFGNRQKAFDAAMRAEEDRAKPMQDTDLRELLRSRMPERKY